jgi:hypothetical protein
MLELLVLESLQSTGLSTYTDQQKRAARKAEEQREEEGKN